MNPGDLEITLYDANNNVVSHSIHTQAECEQEHVEGRCSYLCAICYDEGSKWLEAQHND